LKEPHNDIKNTAGVRRRGVWKESRPKMPPF